MKAILKTPIAVGMEAVAAVVKRKKVGVGVAEDTVIKENINERSLYMRNAKKKTITMTTKREAICCPYCGKEMKCHLGPPGIDKGGHVRYSREYTCYCKRWDKPRSFRYYKDTDQYEEVPNDWHSLEDKDKFREKCEENRKRRRLI